MQIQSQQLFNTGLGDSYLIAKNFFFFYFVLICCLSHWTILGGCAWQVGRRKVVPLACSLDVFIEETIQRLRV